jgi:hypothetical protein
MVERLGRAFGAGAGGEAGPQGHLIGAVDWTLSKSVTEIASFGGRGGSGGGEGEEGERQGPGHDGTLPENG